MMWIRVKRSLTSVYNGADDAALLSRRDVLAGIGLAGVVAVAGSTLLASSPAEARIDAPAIEPQPAPAESAQSEVAECTAPERNLADVDTDPTEFSAQRWRRERRRYWRRGRRRYWRRHYWRPRRWRRRVVCRRRWIRGRLVRVCRRFW